MNRIHLEHTETPTTATKVGIMTNAFTYVHSVAATGMRRLYSGTVSVDLGTSVGLLFDDDAQLRKFITDLTNRHAHLLNDELAIKHGITA